MFKISGSSRIGAVAHTRETAKEAVEKAVQLMGTGLTVTITAPNGRTYESTEFTELFKDFPSR